MNITQRSNGLGSQTVEYIDYLTGDLALETEQGTYVVFTPSGQFIAENTLTTLIAKGFRLTPDTDSEV